MPVAAPAGAPVLKGLRIVEFPAFVAAPLGGLTLAQLGADVIRIDPIGGNMDITRWPLNADGRSLYWASLNRGKRSVEIDVRNPEGKRLVRDLVTAAGEGGGIFLTNLPVDGELSYASLKAVRPDVIMVQLVGSPDGANALDYTVNSVAGFPLVTGDARSVPVNHVVPMWDVAAGLNIALAVLAAERWRRETGEGQFIRLALSDVAMATVSNLGYIAEVEVNDADRQPDGNFLYGAYGDAFETADGRHVMVVAISRRQWQALVRATGMEEALGQAARSLGYSLEDEGGRYEARALISAFFKPWVRRRTLAEVEAAFSDPTILWAPYRTFRQMLAEDKRASEWNPMFRRVAHPGVGEFLTATTPLAFSAAERVAPGVAPRLGQHGPEVMREVLGIDDARYASLASAAIVGKAR
ncbi:MAG TPA: CoA transferase [Burkholderiales bacterium]|nr:CoA transferase [Burkholderiales bacterium]